MVFKNNDVNKDYYKVNDSRSDEKGEKEGIYFEPEFKDELEVTPETTLNPEEVRAMTNLQTSSIKKQTKL